MSRTFCLSFAALTLAGCGSQADTSYRGDPLATIAGSVQSDGTAKLPPTVDAAVVFAQVEFAANAPLVQSVSWVGESTPVTGQFPANFTLDVYLPPPSSVMLACAGSPAHMAFGFIVAVDGAADLSHGDPRSAVVGEANDYMLMYLDSDQPSGWSCFPDMGFTFAPTKGYHLMVQVAHSTQTRYGGATYPAYVEAPIGLATQVAISVGGPQFGPLSGSSGATDAACVSSCNTKAASCGAPAEQAAPVCGAICASSPTKSVLDCIQASACSDLIAAKKSGQPICGTTLTGSNPPAP